MNRFLLVLVPAALLAAPSLQARPIGKPFPGGWPRVPKAHPRALANDYPLTGVVRTDAGEPLPGATIFIKGTYGGTSTNELGSFRLTISPDKGPVELVVAYVGYVSQTIALNPAETEITVNLVPSPLLLSETVVAASRVEENISRAPVTIDKVSAPQIMRISTPEILGGLGNLPGIDVTSASMLFTSISTRGFNTARSERVIQLVDYMDTALPSLNLSPGNLVGIPELDMESIEIIHGPASALYGSNALSGVVLFNSKDPFVYDGLSVRLRGGERNLLDGQLRYAQKLGTKFAFKFNGSVLRADDWVASNYEKNLSSVNPLGSPLGYDAVNRYGDFGNVYLPTQNRPGFTVNPELYGKTVYLPGFTEQEMVAGDNTTRSYRVQGAVSYLIKNDLKLTVEAKRGVGTSTYQNLSRFRAKDLGTNQYRIELKNAKGFIRAYSTEDFSGGTYEFNQLANLMLLAPTTEGGRINYAQQYFAIYNQVYGQARTLNQSPATAQATALAAATASQLKSSDPRFAILRERFATEGQPDRGARQIFNSFLNDISTQRSFHLAAGTDLTLGGAYREYRLGSDGKVFADTNGERLRNYEYGTYGQLTQALLGERLKLALAGRVDLFKNFDPSFSPRASAVYSVGAQQQHNFRASYGQAFRSPTQPDQYLYSDRGAFVLLGNIDNGYRGYTFEDANGQPLPLNTPLSSALEISIDKLRLERVNTFEVGYKGVVLPNLYVDASYFRSRYNDFIGGQAFIGNLDGSRPTPQQFYAGLASNFTDVRASPARVLYVSRNNSQPVRTEGATLGLNYYLRQSLSLGANYSLNVLDLSGLPDGFRTYFNTPKHKFNLTANGTILKNLAYSVSYRWVEGHRQEIPFATGQVRTYSTTDAYLGYTLPKLASTLQAGVSNAFNVNNTQIVGGPQIGRLAYLGLLVNVK